MHSRLSITWGQHHPIILNLRCYPSMENTRWLLVVHWTWILLETLINIGINIIHQGIWKAIRIHFIECRLLHSHHLFSVLGMTTHRSRSWHVWIALKMTLMILGLATVHGLVPWLVLIHTTVAIVHSLIILSDALWGIIHFYGASIKLLTIHFLKSSLGLLFWKEFYKSIAFWFSANRVNDYFCFTDWVISLLEELQQIMVGYIWI